VRYGEEPWYPALPTSTLLLANQLYIILSISVLNLYHSSKKLWLPTQRHEESAGRPDDERRREEGFGKDRHYVVYVTRKC
jgi:hypothetical protein